MARLSIKGAVDQLDPGNDGHWTTDGLPRVDVISSMVGQEVTRRQITDAAPTLTRESRQLEAPPLAASPGVPAAASSTFDSLGGVPAPPVARAEPQTASPVAAAEPDLGHVAARDDVLTMDPAKVFGSLELIERALTETDRQAGILAQRRDRIVRALDELGQRSNALEMARTRLERAQGGRPKTNIQDYLKSQSEARRAKAERAKRFLEAGTTPQDVAAALSVKSKLDSVMGQRRQGPSGVRPRYPRAAE